MDWDDVIADVRDTAYGEKLTVAKDAVGALPDRFKRSRLSISKGADRVYREPVPQDSIQVREYDDRYVLERDRYHPNHHPLRHALMDATIYTTLFLFGNYVAYRLGRRLFGDR